MNPMSLLDRLTRRSAVLTLLATVMVTASCASVVDSAIDSAARRTGESIGRAAGDRIGAAAVSRISSTTSPGMAALYINHLFAIGLHSGTYALEERPYEPGEWTRWSMDDYGDSNVEMERAFLGRTPEGNEWWRVKYTDRSDDGGEIILEGLFSPGREELLRLRALMPLDEEPSELPVEEGAIEYNAPVQLTGESLAGATVGTETIHVPAGTFEARRVRYGTGAGTAEWWLSDRVPGSLVRYMSRLPDGESATVELREHGRGATSELGVM